MNKSNHYLFYAENEMPEGPGLKGMRCHACGHVVQPSAVVCPLCGSRGLTAIVIGQKATLIEHSVVYQDSDLFKAPYTIGLIQVPEGPKVFVPIVNENNESLENGSTMIFSLLPMPETDELNFAYKLEN